MPVSTSKLRPYLRSFDFQGLFVEGLGWDFYRAQPTRIQAYNQEYVLKPVAEKAGFAVYVCNPDGNGRIPGYPVRRRIELDVTKIAYEHLIIFIDAAKSTQVWQWVKREVGKPPAYREYTLDTTQTGTPLLQRLVGFLFTLEDESSGIAINDVTGAVSKALDVEKVTKRFYDRFRKELIVFQRLITGIDGITAGGDREWYASLMLNRMMFVYFIQKQSFLDKDVDYLRNRLRMVQSKYGSGRFQEFYRDFLIRLFHEGLGQPESKRKTELHDLLGQVPYLNGGLFDVHDLELNYTKISIPDKAFERIFDFFDEYRWHLDERPRRKDNEINPDVLGYIFEKYINQKQMGAYYTKEDITGHITRNTIIPFLLDIVKKECPTAFDSDGVWHLLRNEPDRYIYAAAGHGMAWIYYPDAKPVRREKSLDLPMDIAAGQDDVSQRSSWNRSAPPEYALPTETWRELIARRQHYQKVRDKIVAGGVSEVDDLITLNLDIERFAKDVIIQSEGPELLRTFWKAISTVSVLDPTCGSGAFLFAALNILEPLYTACLEGMRGFVEDVERSGQTDCATTLDDFRSILEHVDKHPNQRYFILKSIVLNNLYGVDIMEEAVEICKLRLFLKMMAQLEGYEQIEPLPDIDFNIRAGNTLVGFTSLDEVQKAIQTLPGGQSRLVTDKDTATLTRINRAAKNVSHVFDQFRGQQTVSNDALQESKATLRFQIDNLRDELDKYLAAEYNTDVKESNAYNAWRDSHRPFHWFVEFHGIMEKGGFDVVVGNPPYVEYKTIKKEYKVQGFSTENCENLYAMTWERSISLAAKGHLGMIVPASAVCTDGYAQLRKILISAGSMVVSSYSDNPGKLFANMPHNRLQIILVNRSTKLRKIFTTVYNKWRPDARKHLFQNLVFFESSSLQSDTGIAKVGHAIEASILQKINSSPLVSQQSKSRASQHTAYYTRKMSHFLQILNFIPVIYDLNGKQRAPSELKEIYFKNALTRDGALGLLNSSLFFWLVTVFSDCRNLNRREVRMIRFDVADKKNLKRLASTSRKLMQDIKMNSEIKKQGSLTIQQTFPRQSKAIIDKLDATLAEHYGFTDEELDFVINYDIKYRMGLESSRQEHHGGEMTW